MKIQEKQGEIKENKFFYKLIKNNSENYQEILKSNKMTRKIVGDEEKVI